MKAEGHNPLCGDEIQVYIDVADGIVRDVKISGQGCSISQSSASMMSAAVKGKSIDDIRNLVRRFKHMMSIEEEGNDSPIDESQYLGDLEALQGVVKYLARRTQQLLIQSFQRSGDSPCHLFHLKLPTSPSIG